MEQQANKRKGAILAIMGALMWGIQGPISQFLFQNMNLPTEWLMGVKMTLAGIVILIFTAVKYGKQELVGPWKNPKDAIQLVCYALFGLAMVQYMYFLTIRASDAGTATILQSLGTVLIIIFTAIIYHRLPSRNETIAVIIAIVGTWLLVTKNGSFHELSISKEALIFGLLLATGGALQTMIPVSLLKKYRSFTLLGWGMLMGGLLFTCVHPFWKNPPVMNMETILGIGFIVIFGTVLSYICFTTSLNYISATSAGLLDAFEPASATLGAVLFLGTTFTISQVVGGLLVLSTVFILAIPDKKGGEHHG